MKRIAISFTLLAASLFLTAAQCNKTPQTDPEENDPEVTDPEPEKDPEPLNECTLSIMSFNVAVDKLAPVTGWGDRKKAVINMLSQVKPMVIGFQEAQAHEITDMKNAHPEYDWYGLGRETAKRPEYTTEYSAEETMAVFWLKDSLSVVESGTFWLSQNPDKPGLGWDAKYPRTLTWVHFIHKKSKLQFFMFNTHLDNKGKTARTESMKLIANKMTELNPDGYLAFLTADFNTNSNDAIFAPIKGTMKSTRDVAPDSDKTKMTLNNYTAPKSQIDHIFYLDIKNVEPLTFRVYDQDFGNTWISDHYPVMGTFLYKRVTE